MTQTLRPQGTSLEHRIRRHANESGVDYRRRIFTVLAFEFQPYIDEAVELLQARTLEFASLDAIHRRQLRRALLERHSLPFLLTHFALFPNKAVDVRVLAACLAGHSLALTHLDYHLDGVTPTASRTATAVKVVPASAVSYALRMVYVAGSLLAETPEGSRIHADVLDPISGFVIARMHEDWATRFDLALLERAGMGEVRSYLRSSSSRLLASGYWEVMCKAAVIANGHSPPQALTVYCQNLRRLRQIVDEAADVPEDVRSGLVTLPLLIRLTLPDNEPIRQGILEGWRTARRRAVPKTLLAGLRTHEVGAQLDAYATDVSGDARAAAAALAPETAALFEVLLDLKHAKLEAELRRYA